MLFDKCEDHKKNQKENNLDCKECDKVVTNQDKETESMTDKQFVKVFKNQMQVYGFSLKKWES